MSTTSAESATEAAKTAAIGERMADVWSHSAIENAIPAPATAAQASTALSTPLASSQVESPSATPRPAHGPVRFNPCLICLRSALFGRSDGQCYDSAEGGPHCWRCASGRPCSAVPGIVLPAARRLVAALVAKRPKREIKTLRSAVRVLLESDRRNKEDLGKEKEYNSEEESSDVGGGEVDSWEEDASSVRVSGVRDSDARTWGVRGQRGGVAGRKARIMQLLSALVDELID